MPLTDNNAISVGTITANAIQLLFVFGRGKRMVCAYNDGVHRVAAGGCSKNRKPTGRNSGATLCYCGFDFCIIVRSDM
jgi:hypothetical protein